MSQESMMPVSSNPSVDRRMELVNPIEPKLDNRWIIWGILGLLIWPLLVVSAAVLSEDNKRLKVERESFERGLSNPLPSSRRANVAVVIGKIIVWVTIALTILAIVLTAVFSGSIVESIVNSDFGNSEFTNISDSPDLLEQTEPPMDGDIYYDVEGDGLTENTTTESPDDEGAFG